MMEIENLRPFNIIVVYRLDRISRNVGDFASLIEKLNKENKHLKLENRRLKARCKANIYREW